MKEEQREKFITILIIIAMVILLGIAISPKTPTVDDFWKGKTIESSLDLRKELCQFHNISKATATINNISDIYDTTRFKKECQPNPDYLKKSTKE